MSNKEIYPVALSEASLSELLVRRELGIIATWIDSYSASRLTFKRETTRRAGDHPRWLTEGGLHAWWRTVKESATHSQWEHITDVTFHDLRHDFGHRLRASGFTLEEVAVSLGHVTRKGTPAVGTTARYTQPNYEQMKQKLQDLPI
jgi:integrase